MHNIQGTDNTVVKLRLVPTCLHYNDTDMVTVLKLVTPFTFIIVTL